MIDCVQLVVTISVKMTMSHISKENYVIKSWLSGEKNFGCDFLSWHQNAIGTKSM